MAEAGTSSQTLKFGTFELDLPAGELRKNGRKVRLQEQPFRLLAALVEKQGGVVTREELKDTLWPGDTYVDFDRSLNVAASKLRDALGDSASSPRFIETLPRRGYRFLAPVEGLPQKPDGDDTDSPGGKAAADQGKRVRRAWIAVAVAGAVALAMVTAFWLQPRPEPEPRLRKFPLSLPGYAQAGPTISGAVLSPDAKHIAYASTSERKLAVWDLELGSHLVLEGAERVFLPFWSPDSRSIGFWTETGPIKRVDVDGGPVAQIGEAIGCCAFGTWSPDGETIVYAHQGRLFELPARGGEAREVGASGESKRDPYFLPAQAARLLLFRALAEDTLELRLLDLDTGKEAPLMDLAGDRRVSVVYSPSGHLVYYQGSIVWAVPFSLEERAITGEPFPVAQNAYAPSMATDGTLLYEDSSQARFKLVWVNRSGEKLADATQPVHRQGYFSLSPDDLFVAVTGAPPSLHDVSRLMTTSVGSARAGGVPSWSGAGSEILFSGGLTSTQHIYREAMDGSRVAQVVFAPEESDAFVSDWSRDGRFIFYDREGRDIWYLQADGQGGYEAKPFLTSDFTEKAAVISPNNRLVAYVSDESGKLDVYVRTFPDGERQKVSIDGGRAVRWGRDGRKLYFTSASTLFEADVRLDWGKLVISVPQELFDWPGLGDGANVSAYHRYDVASDGERFLVVETLPEGQPKIQLVQNWYEEFRGREQH